MATQSKVARPSAHPPVNSTSRALPATTVRSRDDDGDKENAQVSLPRRTVPAKRRIEDEDDYEEGNEDDQRGAASDDDHDEGDGGDHNGTGDFDEDGNALVGAEGRVEHVSDDDEEQPARRARTRRVSEKEAQRVADQKDAAARKAAKTARAAKKQRRLEMGEEPVPFEDTVIMRQDAGPSRIRRDDGHRNSRETFETPHRHLASSSLSDWRHSAITPKPMQSQEERRPRLDLRSGASSPDNTPSDVDSHPRDSRRRRPQAQDRRARSESRSPSHSPVAGDKRARSPAHDDIRAAQAQKIHDHQGRVRARDYDDTTQELISITNTWYRCLLAARDAYPDVASETEMVTLAWSKGCEELKVSMRITPDIAKLITRRGPQMRGELKTKVRGLVELVFGFESGQNKKNIRKNRQLAEDLKEGMGYCYSEFPAVAAQRRGMYKAKIIQKSTNLMWFNNRRDEGATHPDVFGPVFPKPAFALVLSAIECSIDEWATGIKTDVPFTAADYRGVYLEHLKCLDEFEKYTAPRDILGNILTRMHNIGRFHSGAQPIGPIKTTSLSKAVLDAAAQEYDENSNTETDGEDGEHSV
ncbi:hypothetical protein DFH09DRAFT_1428065 [Mycena vulgaris]|nr:hypothetical protein DFH09DRAFT_1428065 [Mycena vulgaris]